MFRPSIRSFRYETAPLNELKPVQTFQFSRLTAFHTQQAFQGNMIGSVGIGVPGPLFASLARIKELPVLIQYRRLDVILLSGTVAHLQRSSKCIKDVLEKSDVFIHSFDTRDIMFQIKAVRQNDTTLLQSAFNKPRRIYCLNLPASATVNQTAPGGVNLPRGFPTAFHIFELFIIKRKDKRILFRLIDNRLEILEKRLPFFRIRIIA